MREEYAALAVSLWLALGAVVALVRKKVVIGTPFKGKTFERDSEPKMFSAVVSCYVGSALIVFIFACWLWFRQPN